ncbi:DUF6176 family protein [Gemella cuniculi]|uniref:DUF6176 family protein n=1 Tax=Gemella cuniculi TaxID=150240 RepID=UPI00041E593D|nr:DUF6176 family protein [Gemella cuniculi]
MIVELTRFRVKDGMSEMVDEWLEFLNNNMKDVLLTLDREKMYVETIFREVLDGHEYLYWYSVQGENGQDVETSEHEVDRKHLKYWEKCIDKSFGSKDLTTEVVMISKKMMEAMD